MRVFPDKSPAMSDKEKLKFSNPMMDNEDDDDDVDEDEPAAQSKVENPLAEPLSPAASDHQAQMDEYFAEEENAEEIDEVVPALILYYLFEDATCAYPCHELHALPCPPT